MLNSNLENCEVCSVIFIRDYLQFYFEGEQITAALTTYTLPVSIVNGHYFKNGDLGYRDSLCSFINNRVKKFEIKNGTNLTLTFENNDKLEVSLEKKENIGQEAAMLRVENQIAIW